jgi:GNAT superfamily N-acetyltransferase
MNTDIPTALAERVEAEAYHDFQEGAPPDVRAALGLASLHIAGGVALSMGNDPTSFWSKVLGLGLEQQVTAELIDEICDFYRSEGTRVAVFQIAASQLPDDWPEICERVGLSAGGTLVKLVGDIDAALACVEDPVRPRPAVRVEPATRDQAAAWGEVMMDCFGMPREHLSDMAAGAVGRPGWRQFAAWSVGELVGTAGLYIHGEAGHLFGGAVIPHARRLGGQSALLAARVHAAKEAGCRWVVGETGAESPGTHNTSLHNMLRAGLSVRYERQNWVWRSERAA